MRQSWDAANALIPKFWRGSGAPRRGWRQPFRPVFASFTFTHFIKLAHRGSRIHLSYTCLLDLGSGSSYHPSSRVHFRATVIVAK
jgi:hypothetical protein